MVAAGENGSCRDVVEFLKRALKLLPAGMRIRCVRADSVFFDQKLLGFLEGLELACIVVARLVAPLNGMLHGIQKHIVVMILASLGSNWNAGIWSGVLWC
jgi:hypothetical protein